VSTRVAVIIPAAGTGSRMGAPKPFLELAGRPVLERTLEPFLREPRVRWVVVALDAANVAQPPAWLTARDGRIVIVPGGADRTASVRCALDAVPMTAEVIIVHDAARPLVSDALVRGAIDAAAAGRAVTAAVPLEDTIHVVDSDDRIVTTPERGRLWRAQTPQAFPADRLRAAHRAASAAGENATDDAALVARWAGPVYVIEGERDNFKLTVPADLNMAEALLRTR
jgi:2-C-methyl-D-erythritol 4-phosphate cytidylyltransferase